MIVVILNQTSHTISEQLHILELLRDGRLFGFSPLCISTSPEWFFLQLDTTRIIIHGTNKMKLKKLQSSRKYSTSLFSVRECDHGWGLEIFSDVLYFTHWDTRLYSSTYHQIWAASVLCSLHNSFSLLLTPPCGSQLPRIRSLLFRNTIVFITILNIEKNFRGIRWGSMPLFLILLRGNPLSSALRNTLIDIWND